MKRSMRVVQPKVTVIMPSLNVGQYIRECMESVLGQSLNEIEVLCVDAGSTDGTLEILREYEAKDDRVRIILSDKKSYGYQMNLGINAANGEFIGIVETDDYIALDMYETLYALAVKNELEVVKADYCAFYGNGKQRTFYPRYLLADKRKYGRVLTDSKDFFSAYMLTCSGIYSTCFLKNNKIAYNETPGAAFQDNGFWFQVFVLAHRVMFFNKPFYMYRQDNMNSSMNSMSKVYCMCQEYDFIRNFLKRRPELEKEYAPLCAFYRQGNYEFTEAHLHPRYIKEFLLKYSEDFRKIRDAGELDRTMFSDSQWLKIQVILDDPQAWYYFMHYKVPALDETDDQESRKYTLTDFTVCGFRTSKSYRIGRAITYVPRKIFGGVKCLRDHGLIYTVSLAFKKMKNVVARVFPTRKPLMISDGREQSITD